MKSLIALFAALVVSVAGAQTVQTTPNLVGSTPWTGVVTGAHPQNCCSGGPNPLFDPATNIVHFSYGQATVAKTIAINNALQGTGVQVNGYNWSYEARNMNGLMGGQGGVDTLTATSQMTSNTGAVVLSNTRTHNTSFDWTTFSGTQTATTPSTLGNLGNLSISFSSRDSGFWAGYYGPQVRNPSLSLNYTVDPCVVNPAYSPSCANYNTVVTSNNLVPNPGGYAVSGYSIDQSYAINQALAQSGANVMVHGFQWGYQANANGAYCANWFVVCWDNRVPSVTTNVSITDNNNNNLYSISRTYTDSYNTTNYQYVFPSSRNMLSLGNFNFTASTNDAAYIGDMWSRALYTPDPCTVNPLSSTTCPGYAQAYQEQQCSINPLYAVTCPGYAAAYLTQQCSANPLFSPSCPGYAQAYFTQQCSINPLYSVDCPGYAQAYKNQQCSISALYATDCPGYAQAFKSQQCSISALYATDCPGYDVAYKSQQCNLNALYATDCPGYQQAYLTQQCNISQLYSTSCPNYQQAYFNQQCQLNGLYDRTCPNYATAYATKNVLSATAPSTPTTASTATTSAPVEVASTSTSTTSSNPAATAISDPVVSNAVSTPSTTSATSPTSVTSVIAAPTTATPTGVTSMASVSTSQSSGQSSNKEQNNNKDQGNQSNKEQGSTQSSGNRGSATASAGGGNRQAPKEPDQKQAEARAKAANEGMKNATRLEDQVAAQGAVVNAMAFVPGFTTYQNSTVPDINQLRMARQYSNPPIDNNRTQRLLGGAQEQRWNEMVNSQYNNYNRGN